MKKNYCELKESVKMMKTLRSDTEGNTLIEEGKIKDIVKITRQDA